MSGETAKDADGAVFDIEGGRVLHAVEEHQQVLIARDERVELRVQVLQHCDSDSVVVVSGGRDEELVQELIHYSYHHCAQSLYLLTIPSRVRL